MVELTPELNLIKGQDPDDTADYLTISLADSLDIIDGLFSQSTGHNHNGAHQGGNLVFQDVTIGGNLTVTGALVAQGAATFQSTLLATGAVTLQSTLNVTGLTTLAAVNANSLTVSGVLNANAGLTTSTLTTTGRITSGSDVVINGGSLYLAASGDTLLQRASADALRVPSTLYFGPGVTDTYLQRSGPIGGSSHPLILSNGADGLWILNGALTFYNPSDPQPGGSQTLRVIKPSTRSATTYGGGEISLSLRLGVDGDIYSGTYMHAISFIQTSDMAVKQNTAAITDADCMTRVRRPMQVYSYEIPPPVEPGAIAPTATDIGFSADEVFASNPEFAALNAGDPVGVNYSNMSALLWGAVRDIDARLQARGI